MWWEEEEVWEGEEPSRLTVHLYIILLRQTWKEACEEEGKELFWFPCLLQKGGGRKGEEGRKGKALRKLCMDSVSVGRNPMPARGDRMEGEPGGLEEEGREKPASAILFLSPWTMPTLPWSHAQPSHTCRERA